MEKLNYKSWINFNWNITELKNWNDAIKLLNHIFDNMNRETGRERLNKKPELKNVFYGKSPELIKKEFEKIQDKLPKGGKGAKPFRFITTALNVEPTEKNIKVIQEWFDKQLNLYKQIYGEENIICAGLHLNETRPGIHIAIKNYSKQAGKWVWGVYKNGVRVKTSGPDGKKLVNEVWDKGQELNKKLAEKYGLEFKQAETTNIRTGRTIQQVRKTKVQVIEKIKEVVVPQVKEIQKYILQPVKSEALIISNIDNERFRVFWEYDLGSGQLSCWEQSKGSNGEWMEQEPFRWEYWRSKSKDIQEWGKHFKGKVKDYIMGIQPENEAIKDLKEHIKDR